MLQDTGIIVATFMAYMLVCLTLGFVAYRRTSSLGDFILGGRSLGAWVTALSAQATDMSGWLLMGLPGLAYATGYGSAWMVLGLVVGTWLNWRYVAAPLRRSTEALGDALTLPVYFERRFDDRSRLLRSLTAFFILVFFVFYTSSGFVAAGKLFETLFGIPYPWAVFAGSIVMLAYTFFGGFLAVSWSDVLQGSLMFFALVLVAGFGLQINGGIGGMHETMNALNPSLLDPFVDPSGAPLGWIGIASLLAWGLGYPGQPHILARFMAIRSADELVTARRVAISWQVTVLIAALIVGFTGIAALDHPLVGADRERVFIFMSVKYFNPVIAGVCLSGILAAVMSTASAQLLLASSAFAEDFYRGFARPDAGRRELLWVGRGAVLAIAVLAFAMALNPSSTVLELVSWAWAGFGAAFGPAIVLSLYWQGMTRQGAFAGVFIGGLTVILWKQFASFGGVFALYELVPGSLLSTVAILAVSRLTRRA